MQWGAWAAGMAADAATLARVRRSGMGALAPEVGMQALAAVLHSAARPGVHAPPSTFVAAPVYWGVLLRGKPAPPFFAEFAPAAVVASGSVLPASGTSLVSRAKSPTEPLSCNKLTCMGFQQSVAIARA